MPASWQCGGPNGAIISSQTFRAKRGATATKNDGAKVAVPHLLLKAMRSPLANILARTDDPDDTDIDIAA